MITYLSPFEQARRAYPDLFDRYIIWLYGYRARNIILSTEQAEEFMGLCELEDSL